MKKAKYFNIPSPYSENGNPGKYVSYDWDKWVYNDQGVCVFSYTNKNGGLNQQVWSILKNKQPGS